MTVMMMMLAAAALAQDAPQVPSPAELVSGWISDEDYPVRARRAREEGVARIRFTVTTDGNVTGCSMVESTGSVSLDVASCVLVTERFRFKPARDASGNAIPDWKTQSIRWQLPEGMPEEELEPLSSHSFAVHLKMGNDGDVVCDTRYAGTVTADVTPCEDFAEMPALTQVAMLNRMSQGQGEMFFSVAQFIGEKMSDVAALPSNLSYVERVSIRFTVDSEGNVIECSLDGGGSDLLLRHIQAHNPCEAGFRYEPPTDESGNPVSRLGRVEVVRALASRPIEPKPPQPASAE